MAARKGDEVAHRELCIQFSGKWGVLGSCFFISIKITDRFKIIICINSFYLKGKNETAKHPQAIRAGPGGWHVLSGSVEASIPWIRGVHPDPSLQGSLGLQLDLQDAGRVWRGTVGTDEFYKD